ncbi:MAG: hypothetical protein ACRC1D_09410 [Culicoidibacterales bacterium]
MCILRRNSREVYFPNFSYEDIELGEKTAEWISKTGFINREDFCIPFFVETPKDFAFGLVEYSGGNKPEKRAFIENATTFFIAVE